MSNHNYLSVMLNRNYIFAVQHVAVCNTGATPLQRRATARAMQQFSMPTETLMFVWLKHLASNLLSIVLRAGVGAKGAIASRRQAGASMWTAVRQTSQPNT
jgi:hypothetical protein